MAFNPNLLLESEPPGAGDKPPPAKEQDAGLKSRECQEQR
jgi:hypothetical protein